MPRASTEFVLGLPTERLHLAGHFQGFRVFDPAWFAILLDPHHLEFRPRGPAETDPRFKQLIPYIVLRYGDSLFHYRRGQAGTETRLRALRSIGIGGHINADADAAAPDPYRAGLHRELAEELDLQSTYRESILGLINDDSTPVGSVHLGVVHLFDLDEPKATPREDGITAAGFAPIVDLRAAASEFETWSQLVLHELSRCSR